MKNNDTINERELLDLIGRFYKERNIGLIKPYLHSNFIYASAWVGQVFYGTTQFLNYIGSKFSSQADAEWNMDYVILPLTHRRQHFLVLKQNNERDKTVMAGVEFKNNRIYYIHLFPARRVASSYIEPSRYFIKAKETESGRRMLGFARRLDIKNVLQCISKGAKINVRDEHGETALTIFSKVSPMDSYTSVLDRYSIHTMVKNEAQWEKIKRMEDRLKVAGYFKELEFGENWRESFAQHDLSKKLLDSYARRVLKLPTTRRIEMMKKLIERGADVDDLNLSLRKQARNALYYSVQQRDGEVVEFLLQNGADANFKYPGVNESLTELAIRLLKTEEQAGEGFLLRDGKDVEMQRQEIENLKKIIALLEKAGTPA